MHISTPCEYNPRIYQTSAVSKPEKRPCNWTPNPQRNNRVLTPCKHSRNRSARSCEWISYKMKMFRFGPARFPRLSCGPIFNHACTLLYSAYLLFPLVIQIWNMSKQRVQTALRIIKNLAGSHDRICLARWRNHNKPNKIFPATVTASRDICASDNILYIVRVHGFDAVGQTLHIV